MANNKVQLADGSVLIDLTNDTVTANVLKAGYTAHDASGNIVTGTMDAGGTGIVLTGEINQNGSKTLYINGVANESLSSDVAGGMIDDLTGTVLLDLSDDTVSASVLKSGFTAHDSMGRSVIGTLIADEPVLGTKTITANGTYNASSDSLDGYSSVTVAIPTGGSPTGTKQISITQNGTTTEDVANYANAEITVNVSGGGPHEVPAGYTQLKFLQSSGTQWIKTSVVPTLETQIQVTGQRLVTTGYNALAGSVNPTILVPMNNGVYARRYYITFGNSGEKNIDEPFPVGSAFPPVFTVNKTKATFDTYGMAQKSANIGATGMGTPVDANTRVALFGRYNGTTNVCTCTAGIIFRAKFWESGVLIGDYVPAKRDADDVLGMYDIVNDVFYTNNGTGVFIGGEYE